MIFFVCLFLSLSLPVWAADIAVVRQAMNTGTGTQNFTSAETWTPGAALFILTRATTDGTVAAQNALGVGCTDGTRELTISIHAADNVSSMDSSTWQMSDKAIALVDTSTNTIDTEANFSSWLTGGVQINITNAPTSAYLLTVILFNASFSLRCDTFTTNATQDATQDITTVGFQPDTVFLVGTGDNFDDVNHSVSQFCWGVVDSGSAQASLGYGQNGAGAATSAVASHLSTSKGCHVVDNSGTEFASAELSAFDAQGFTVTTRFEAVARDFLYLAVNWGGLGHWAGIRTTPTSTGTQAVTTPGFQPQAGFFWPSVLTATDADATDSTAEVIGFTAVTVATQFSTAIRFEDGLTTSNTCALSDNVAFHIPSAGSGTCAVNFVVATFTSFDATGWTLNWTQVNGTAREYLVFMLEVAPVAAQRSTLRLLMH